VTAPTLTEFLLARIAEDEAEAHAATGHAWRVTRDPLGVHVEHDLARPMGRVAMRLGRDMGIGGNADAAHIARHDPARALAECEAKRRIVEVWPDSFGSWTADQAYAAKRVKDAVLLDLATVYADHPDYDEAWRP